MWEHVENIRRLLKEMEEIRTNIMSSQLRMAGHSKEQAEEISSAFFEALKKEVEDEKEKRTDF